MTLASPAALASAMVAAALLLAACGGGDSDDPTATPTAAASTPAATATAGTPAAAATASPTPAPPAQPSEAMTVASADGVLTVEISAGAAADGVEVEVARIADEQLPSELRGADAVVLGYELGPDGAQFSEPVALTFRVDPNEHGLDLPAGAVPLGLLLTRNAAGELESVDGATLSREGDLVVARGTVTHFTPAVLVITDNVAVRLAPEKIELEVGQIGQLDVTAREPIAGGLVSLQALGFDLEGSEWSATDPFAFHLSEFDFATIFCTAPTDGWVTDAYRVFLDLDLDTEIETQMLLEVFGLLDIFGVAKLASGITLAGDGKCNEATEATETTTEPAEGTAVAVGGGTGEEVPDDSESGDSAGDADSPPPSPPTETPAAVPPGTYPVRGIYSGGTGGCGTPGSFQDDLIITVTEDSTITITQPSTGDSNSGTLNPDGSFTATQSNPTESYTGRLNSDGSGEAVNTYKDSNACVSTWQVSWAAP